MDGLVPEKPDTRRGQCATKDASPFLFQREKGQGGYHVGGGPFYAQDEWRSLII